jgi:hypothetical protein
MSEGKINETEKIKRATEKEEKLSFQDSLTTPTVSDVYECKERIWGEPKLEVKGILPLANLVTTKSDQKN